MSGNTWRARYKQLVRVSKPLIHQAKQVVLVDDFSSGNWIGGSAARAFRNKPKLAFRNALAKSEVRDQLQEIIKLDCLRGRLESKCQIEEQFLKQIKYGNTEEQRSPRSIFARIKIIDLALKELFFLQPLNERKWRCFDPPLDRLTLAPLWPEITEDLKGNQKAKKNPTMGSIVDKGIYIKAQELLRGEERDPFSYEFVFWHLGMDPLLRNL